jgi:branched-chain amino acid transport system substrate-binding protein
MRQALAASVIAVCAAATAPAWGQVLRGVTDKEIVIGMHTDLSGPAAFYGVSSRNAAQMRYDLVNAQGGIHGRKIKLVVEDTQYQVPRGVAAVNKLINRDKVFAIVGAFGTPIVNAAFRDQEAARVPNLFPLTLARSMSQPLNRLKFALGSSYYDQIRAGVSYLVAEKQSRTLCALYEDTDFGQEVLEGIRDQAKAMNVPLAETAPVKPTDTDFSAPVTKLRQAKCDLIAMGSLLRTTILPLGTAKRMGWNEATWFTQSGAYEYMVAAAPGKATEGLYAGSGFILPYSDTASPELQAWMAAYQERFKADLNIGAIFAWQGADLTVTALDRAGRNLTTDGFIAAIEGIKGYRDIFGGPVMNFSETNHQGSATSYLSVVKDGRWVPVLKDGMTY